MAQTDAIKDRDFSSFVESPSRPGNSAREVTISGDTGLLEGIVYDDIQATYPNATTENYAYYLNAVLQATIQVTYTNASKSILIRARRI